MSTSYYRLAKPVTHLNIRKTPSHYHVGVFINHALAGELCVRAEEATSLFRLFQLYEEDNVCPLRTWWGGPDKGAIVEINDKTLPDEAIVISEYGEPLTVGEVKARKGARRKDGMPTELFGYEKPKL